MGTFRKRPIRYPLFVLSIFGIVTFVLLCIWNIGIGIGYGIGFVLLMAYTWKVEKITFDETEKHIESISFRMKKVGEEALLEMPIGILLVNDQYEIEWSNPYMQGVLNMENLVGEGIVNISDDIYVLMKTEETNEDTITLRDRKYRVYYKKEENLLYFFDITEQIAIEKQYYADRTVIAILFVDNYDEITQAMDDQPRSLTNTMVTSIVNDWAAEQGIFVKRISSDRFLAVLNESILMELEKKKFAILDTIREKTAQKNMSLTLSIGVGAGSSSLMELGELAQSSLDLVLGRGGDQVAIKQPTGKLKFYGGKTNPVEKRTRVRARVISHALRDLIQDSDQVFVMGHKNPDMDSIGASVGVRKMAQMNDVKGYVIINYDELNGSVTRLMNEIESKSDFYENFLTPEEAAARMTEKSLLVIVDTHKPDLVIESQLLKLAEKVVVIDHHRRSEDFIENPTLVYMEPYASSTAELVTELLEYQPKRAKINMLEATALLAGIIVDTKSFTLRTGARTFEAASYLRTNGADTVLVQRLLKEDVDTYIERSKIVQTVKFVKPGIAIAVGEEAKVYDSVLIAQTADILLTMKDVGASFVIAHRSDGKIGISARSLGEVNVQLVMEKLGGGGHLTNAACQVESNSIAGVKKYLEEAINEVLEGSSES
ncbi:MULTISPECIES: DHH family phosphoesterase [unclassified Lysinibacillus]|uniref:DHH family phosphoesterase n=1 Tax=unclassified Lysinibacillus TaxID=2636778 RepID=UPI002012D8D6|nr:MULTISPECIES: DHH family phosphoesterase [unclassified Lysinibacillus]MCL1697670.1 DHH family phosphoesterase [Lysinibacillus sp. BPa_S21]MCL1702272.1 DHH family phosphoesterase [Lysinibacillus sp. Bpr_S20]